MEQFVVEDASRLFRTLSVTIFTMEASFFTSVCLKNQNKLY